MLPNSSTGRRWFELTSQMVVVYSIVVFYMESELTSAGTTRAANGFWRWNEWLVLTLFSLEYLYRWAQSADRRRYPFTLLAVIDMLVIVPSVMGLTMNLRSLKLLRVLPLLWMLKLYRYNRALHTVMRGFRRVKDELVVVGFVAGMVLVFSAIGVHEFERAAQPEKFGRLSDSLWWSFVTLTTVGYGDLYPITAFGRAIAVATMLLGIGILGTFISLIGGSFLTTMRDQNEPLDDEPAGPITIPGRQALEAPWTRRRAG
jgi:voltage-gated potassium channel